MNKFFAIAATIALSLTATVASARPVSEDMMGTLHERSILAPGDFGWDDDAGLTGKVTVRINLLTQMAYVMRGNILVGITNISSGKDGYETPTGRFTILGKEDNHWSKKYKADMPWTMWINNDGVALHSGSTPGRTTSHGCVHLPHAFAEKLYAIVDRGATVIITDKPVSLELDLFS
jgi:hypothetical protein